MPEVRITGLSKSYGEIIALKDVSLEVNDGEYVCVVGPSGCGKTTLIKSIAGIVKPDRGDVIIDGELVTLLPIEDRTIGYVFQEIALFPHMNVYDNVSYGLMVRGDSAEERRGIVTEMLNMLTIGENSRFYPVELSGGARQKTAIARALASGSMFLLLDEPLGALDLKVRTMLRYELKKLVKELGLTAVHVTHDQEEALSIADKIVVMKAGGIVEVGSPQELYLYPSSIFTAKFLGEANFMVGRLEGNEGEVFKVNVVETKLSVIKKNEIEINDLCVLAIRPEFVKIINGSEGKYSNVLRGKVIESTFLGDLMNYMVEVTPGLHLQVKTQLVEEESDISLGDRITIALPEEHLLIYKFPKEGLEKELALE